ncbi:MAG TPA: methyltransferase domain-containing protein [Thermodesulfobacteriota bacterium]|nr:methyltransferase domain-containing protein [Thermodesulfobacteriota bacterium]
MELESIKKIYAGYSNVYDVIFKSFFYPRIKHAIHSMGIMPGDRILDVGVGTGLSLPLFPRHCKVVGIDLSSAMLKKARQKIKKLNLNHIELLEMDAMNLDFPDNAFDKVLISHVVSVVPDPFMAMSEVKRVCKKGGRIVIINHFKSKNKVMAGMEKIFNPVSKKIGWRSDLCLDEFIEKADLKVDKKYKLKKTDLWHVIFAINDK